MADLERMQGPPDVVLEEAARILGIDLDKTIERSSIEPVYKTASRSQGFKEQWVLRWLLKTLGVSDSKSKSATGKSSDSQRSFILCAKFWSLLLNLTCSITHDVCSEILLERHFYRALVDFIRELLQDHSRETTPVVERDADDRHEGPPMKKRRISPSPYPQQVTEANHEELLWIALQTACCCVDLFSAPSSPRKTHCNNPAWTGSLKAQAVFLGMLLKLLASIIKHSSKVASGVADGELVAGMLNTLLNFWDGGASANSSKGDERHQAFASYCLIPCLSLLDLLIDSHSCNRLLGRSRNALERLVALHVVFPLRTTFNDQFTKKWRFTTDVLLYEQMETLLKAYSNQTHSFEGQNSLTPQAVAVSSIQQLSWMILDVAARSIPFSDIRRRQLEQQYIDTLFIWLVHVSWPNIPRITSTGVLQQQQFVLDQDDWVSPLERLLDVVHSKKLHISTSIASYVLQAVLATDAKSAPWKLLTKVIQLDINILIPRSGSPASKDFLHQVMGRIESSTVSQSEYDLVRDQLILPLLRTFARSRYLNGFISAWQSSLAEAMRIRHISRYGKDEMPTVLVWEDDDVFDEFKTLIPLHAPPNMCERMLKDLVGPVKGVGEMVGSTADVFAKLAIFSPTLEATLSESDKTVFTRNQLAELFHGAMDALRRKVDYQGQRWRLRKLTRLLVEIMDFQTLPPGFDSLLAPEYNFVSLQDSWNFDDDDSGKRNAKYLEALECFYFVVELAANSERFRPNLEVQADWLAGTGMLEASNSRVVWRGRYSGCNNIDELVAACVGKLIQRSEVFLMYPQVFEKLVSRCLQDIVPSASPEAQSTISPHLYDLWLAVLNLESLGRTAQLRNLVFEDFATVPWAREKDKRTCRNLLEHLSLETMSKPVIKKFAASIHYHLFEKSSSDKMETIAGYLDLLVYLDSTFPEAFINRKHWRDWIKFSQESLEWMQGTSPLGKLIKCSNFLSTYLTALRLLGHIFQAMWSGALKASKHKPKELMEICSEMTSIATSFKMYGEDVMPFSCLQMFLAAAWKSVNDPNQRQSLEDIRDVLISKLEKDLNKALEDAPDSANLLKLKLIVQAANLLGEAGLNEEIQPIILSIQRKLEETDHFCCADDVVQDGQRVELSLRRHCLSSTVTLGKKPGVKELESDVQKLDAMIRPQDNWTNGALALLAAQADLVVRQIKPEGWSFVLESTRDKSKQMDRQPACTVIQASVLVHVKQKHILLHPLLAHELAEIACLDMAKQVSTIGLFLALDNCKTVLELHPLVVNQSILDRLLASVQSIASPATDNTTSLNNLNTHTSPDPFDVYERICAVIGAILSRHRRRLSDRYHLLLPVLQSLLRCLFWPGQSVLEGQRGSAANAITTFGKTLPKWMYESTESLPLSSAEHFSRLLSSLCNPTVSAARSSNKRGRNELNDEVKKARKQAGQHMQYLVTEYCRCILDGQISPTMKNQLMPGMYKVMDAVDGDVKRAMNAGMDPSSRAIFKNLFENWTRYGKWDKS